MSYAITSVGVRGNEAGWSTSIQIWQR